VFFVRVEEINYERDQIWTGKVWIPMRNCVEIPRWSHDASSSVRP